jgi:hypothetical protein
MGHPLATDLFHASVVAKRALQCPVGSTRPTVKTGMSDHDRLTAPSLISLARMSGTEDRNGRHS